MKNDLCGASIEPLGAYDRPDPPLAALSGTSAAQKGSGSCAWLFQAEEFRDTIHMLLEWLSEAEQTLRFRGALPDDTEALQSLIDTHIFNTMDGPRGYYAKWNKSEKDK